MIDKELKEALNDRLLPRRIWERSKKIDNIRIQKIASHKSKRPTNVYRVYTKWRQYNLGLIKWSKSLRAYGFYPNDSTVFDHQSLRQISVIVNDLEVARRKDLMRKKYEKKEGDYNNGKNKRNRKNSIKFES